MPIFHYPFIVNAPLIAVNHFHHEPSVLQRLMPPPLLLQSHRFEPLAEGSQAEFTIWFGPLPIRWLAIHSQVGLNGFTDTQQEGPMARWQHSHRFTALDSGQTRIEEHIEYDYPAGAKGRLLRLIFNRPGLSLLFTYRQIVTRWALRQYAPAGDLIHRLPRVGLAAALFMIAGLLIARLNKFK